MIDKLMRFWDATEAKLGVNLGPRDVALLAIGDSDVRRFASTVGLFGSKMVESERVAMLWSLLWPRGDALRRYALTAWNPFRPDRESNPALVRSLVLDTDGPPVPLLNDAWRDRVDTRLREIGAVRVAAPANRSELLRNAVVELLARPIAIGHLKLYPIFERISRTDSDLIAAFVLRERV
jgi:hypothetical protein